MKKFKTLTCDVTEEYYRSFPALSYSKIAKFEINGPSSLIDSPQKITDSMKFGSIVDTLLTNAEEFNNKYYVADITKPSEALCTIVQHILSEVLLLEKDQLKTFSTLDILPNEYLITVLNKFSYRTTLGDEARLKYLFKEGGNYYVELLKANQKEIIPVETYNQAIKLVVNLKNSKFIPSLLFKPTRGIEVLKQAKILFGDLKSMYDYIIINHNEKTITPIDLKIVDYKTSEFLRSFFKFKYYRQGEVYSALLSRVIENDKHFQTYTVLPFMFLVASKVEDKVLQYQFTPTYNENNNLIIFDKSYPSYLQLIEEINWHLENKEFTYSKQEFEQNGIIIITTISKTNTLENTFLNEENI